MGATTRDPNVNIPVESDTPPVVRERSQYGAPKGIGQGVYDRACEVPNPDQLDSDHDGVGDACDPCVHTVRRPGSMATVMGSMTAVIRARSDRITTRTATACSTPVTTGRKPQMPIRRTAMAMTSAMSAIRTTRIG